MTINLSGKKAGDLIWNSRYMKYEKVVVTDPRLECLSTANATVYYSGKFKTKYGTISAGPSFFNSHEECCEYIRYIAIQESQAVEQARVQQTFADIRKDIYG